GCIKLTDPTGDDGAAPARPAAPPRVRDVVPARLQQLPVFIDGPVLLVDPERRAMQTLAATTDNSNTQFATLALSAPRRHAPPPRCGPPRLPAHHPRASPTRARRLPTTQNCAACWPSPSRFGVGLPGRNALPGVGPAGRAGAGGLPKHPPRPEVLDPGLVRG